MTRTLFERSSRWAAMALALTILALGAPAGATSPPDDGRTAPLLEGMGEHTHSITTDDPMAQRYFDQGLVLAWGFNHAEAARSFREAARRDPQCAMCWWGAALVLGPNINAAMEEDSAGPAFEALSQARALAAGASERERAYIEALAARYSSQGPTDRAALDRAYADAMLGVAERYPDDLDAAALHAEALMDLHPWDFWTREGEAQPWTPEILARLESVLERAPAHPGATHLYIHAVEASPEPERAQAAADRLDGLVPGAGHLVHMPSHIYIRVGRYADAARANQQAIESDESYVTQCHAQGLYPLAYMPHNRHFLWFAASQAGRAETAIRAAREMSEHIDRQAMRAEGMGTLQHFWVMPVWALVRFDRWDEVLAEPEPPRDLIYPRGVWHYARGLSFASQGKVRKARRELKRLERLAVDDRLAAVTIWDINTSGDLLAIAAERLAGEIADRRGDLETALARLERGVELEDELNYDEPPPWGEPVRQTLGAILLAAGRSAEAEAVYREDLHHHAENGWSLFGLAVSLRAQGRDAEAAEAGERFERAWRDADVRLASSSEIAGGRSNAGGAAGD